MNDFTPKEYAPEAIEPWPQAVRISDVLDDVIDQFYAYSHVSSFEITHVSVALWASATWLVDYCNHFPMALITAPEAGAGKTTCLEIIGKMCKNPLQTANASASSMFRIMHKRPSLLIDEVDVFLKKDGDLIGILNSGSGINGSVLRCETDPKTKQIAVFEYPTYGAKALCGINSISLPETITSRSIVIELAKKPKDRRISDFLEVANDRRKTDDFDTIKRKLARLENDYCEIFQDAKPPLPDWLQNRNRQNWTPLLKMAYLASPEWFGAALLACESLTNAGKSNSLSENLLADIKKAFEVLMNEGDDSILPSAELIAHLCDDEFAGWLTYNRGSQITARQIGQRLKPHGIHPLKTKSMRGYRRSQFLNVWASYVD